MSAIGSNLCLGIVLGWLKQAMAKEGQTRQEITQNLAYVVQHGTNAGYVNLEGAVAVATQLLGLGNPIRSLDGQIEWLLGAVDAQAVGENKHAFHSGLRLGRLQQGARDGSLPIWDATRFLVELADHATQAGFKEFQPSVTSAQVELSAGRPLASIADELARLTGVLQNQC